jgi:hypothetical protein
MKKAPNLKVKSTGYEKVDIDGVTYLVQTDTSENGVITVTYSPTDVIAKELESKINGINGELIVIQKQMADLTALEADLQKQLIELEGLKI